jgi:uncharacterized membrane-anchored protein
MTAKLGTVAKIKVPAGYLFADSEGARTALERSQNIPSGDELGIIVPASEDESWWVLFEFNDTGFIKDDEKSSLDAAKLLDSIQKNTEEANEEREKKGWKPFHVMGWYTQPYYDAKTNNLTWAINGAEDKGIHPSVNYSIRILGRRGTMNVDVILGPTEMGAVEPKFKALMTGFSFTTGNRYADFVEGDKVAEYGLTALIAGGATAVAIKTGLFARFWKLLVVLFIAIMGAIRRLWDSIKRFFSGDSRTSRKRKGPYSNIGPT